MAVMIGLDVGEKRIGVAKTDELGLMAHAVGFVRRTSDEDALAEISRLVLEWRAERLVLGLPRNMSGKIGPMAEKVMRFGDALRKRLPQVAVEYWDERLSSKARERALIGWDLSRGKRRKVLDKLAAQEILQNYLDAHMTKFPGC